MEIGSRIIWTNTLDEPSSIRLGTVTKMGQVYGESCVWVDNQHKPEDCIIQAFAWPASCINELRTILQNRKDLKKWYDDSIKQVYELRNRVTKGEFSWV